ncbi:YdiU family protein [Thalassotalea maritima]|uniref:protein adenylyltransferase SelO n=1 Tax=Thalassotalea maritima TaxID=3242416 RepID=UPI00352728FC
MDVLSNQYLSLGKQFYQRSLPCKAPAPSTLLFNNALAEQIGFSTSLIGNANLQAKLFSGTELFAESEPLALAYAGHQFGQLNPQLGDGRAHLLGEITSSTGTVTELQLKGSGQTPFSRGGDGKCALGPAIREYLMSEALHGLGIATTRTLAVVTTGETVWRDQPRPGAIVTRTAQSHIRVGSLQYFAIRGDYDSIRALADIAIDRHYPHINKQDDDYLLQFLNAVIDKQIALIVSWLRVGFIHGVMNTDNSLLSGETIDYGPCAMMGAYHPGTVYSSIDHQGRYAFGNQAAIGQWNMARLAETLLALVSDDSDKAIEQVKPILFAYSDKFQRAYQDMLANKLGFTEQSDESRSLAEQLLNIMQENGLDYTQTFITLSQVLAGDTALRQLDASLCDWCKTWQAAISNTDNALALMAKSNPLVIPRNHHVEALIEQSYQTNSTAQIDKFLAVVTRPYQATADIALYQDLPSDGDKGYQTFCGT